MDTVNEILAVVLPHWPFVCWTIVSMLVGQVMAHRIFTLEQAKKKRKTQWIWWWGRKTLPLHPVVTGSLLGLVWRNPEGADPAWVLAADIGYFALAGALSIWGYQFLKGLAKSRGVDLDSLPGDSTPPSPPPVP